MELARRIELLDELINAANNGRPDNFQQWKDRVEVVLRSVFGDPSPLLTKFRDVQYSPSVWFDGLDTSNYEPAGVMEVVSILEAGKLELQLGAEVESSVSVPDAGESKAVGNRIFIVHGHDDANKYHLQAFLTALTGVAPVILHQEPNRGQVILEKFEQSAAATGFAVVLLTADDLGRAKGSEEDRPRGRQNVVFEMGFFFGAFGRSRVAVLFEEGVEIPGDAAGLVYTALDAAGAWRSTIAREISEAGITVDWSALGKF